MDSNVCLGCGEKLDACEKLDTCSHVKDDEARPSPGDITVCLYCGHVMAFAEGLALRALTDAEVVMVAGNKDLLETQRLVGLWREQVGQ